MNFEDLGASDCLVLWTTEIIEKHPRVFPGFDVVQNRLPLYTEDEPPRPVFYVPADTRNMSRLAEEQNNKITLITDGEGEQDAMWQINKIQSLMQGKALRTAEMLTSMGMCLDINAPLLKANGVAMVTAIYPDGYIKIFR